MERGEKHFTANISYLQFFSYHTKYLILQNESGLYAPPFGKKFTLLFLRAGLFYYLYTQKKESLKSP
ncbi:hypothetical protein HQ36_07900 [Porphyromonas gingivicanis]|uniref:Uncharacterized protein n=1 Tax=Porphyromonas gingivicanis TaxID=266762 RepID=A0A0A2G4H1_9PORP|nr:hypothetical protein HQ36_07900 [Porphyromonas gingivicanis]